MQNQFVDDVNALLAKEGYQLLPGPSKGYLWPRVPDVGEPPDFLFETKITFVCTALKGEATAEEVANQIRERIASAQQVLKQE